jgi:hypothetical protein
MELQRRSMVKKPGTDVMIFQNIFAEKFGKTIAFFAQITASFCKNISKHFFKPPFFRQKLAKIAENYDHNIDPRVSRIFFIQYTKTAGKYTNIIHSKALQNRSKLGFWQPYK